MIRPQSCGLFYYIKVQEDAALYSRESYGESLRSGKYNCYAFLFFYIHSCCGRAMCRNDLMSKPISCSYKKEESIRDGIKR